nr:PREDICTED: sorting and assembly machinery component 50 homolog [Bemisia tabaci]
MGGRFTKIPVVETETEDDTDWSKVGAFVQKVVVDGVRRTKDFVIHDQLKDVLEAKNFADVIKQSIAVKNKLEALGIFQKVGVLIDVSRGPDAVEDGYEVTFFVQESSRIKGGISSSFTFNELNCVVGLQLPNFTGIADRVFTEFGIGSNKSKSFHVSYLRPLYSFDRAIYKASVFQNISQRPMAGFKLLEQGISSEISASFSPWGKQTLQWEGTIRNLSVLAKSVPFDVREHSGYTLKSSLRHILSLDTRNSSVLPTNGSLIELINEFAGLGGNVKHFKHELSLQFNCPLVSDYVLQQSFKCGLIHNFGKDYKAEPCDLFFLGGPLTLRGFQQDGIGPQVDGYFLGAPIYWASSLHLYTPIPFAAKSSLISFIRPHLFLNCGNISNLASNDLKSKVVDLSKNICVSTGLGLCLRIGQIARLEINYCVPLSFHHNDATIHGPQCGVGFTFL